MKTYAIKVMLRSADITFYVIVNTFILQPGRRQSGAMRTGCARTNDRFGVNYPRPVSRAEPDSNGMGCRTKAAWRKDRSETRA